MKPETERISRPSNRQRLPNVSDVLIQMQRSGRIHFLRSLPKTTFQTASTVSQTAELSLPKEFVQENDKKIEEWVILRARLSSGRSSRPWLVRLSFSVQPLEAVEVRIAGGWPEFVADNRLKEADYLIFVLKEDARSEFEVYMFCGPWGNPYFPDELRERSDSQREEENASDSGEEEEENESEYFPNEGERSHPEGEEENTNNQTRLHSPVHQQEEHNQAFTTVDIREGNPASLQHTENSRMCPGFLRRLTAYNIARSGGKPKSGQFEFPSAFVRTHGEHVRDYIKLQGQWLKGRARASVFTYG